MAKLAPIFNDAQFINAIPANGAKLFTYAAGSSTKLATYTDEDGLVAQSNPIILNSRGEPAQPIWLLEGLKYKFVFAPSTDTDPPVSPIRTIDDISGINDTSLTIDQWVDSGLTPTYVSATSFTVAGDQTSLFTNKRRIKSLVTAGTAYSTVLTSTFGVLTTVSVANDSLPLDTGLSSIQVGLLTPNNQSIPSLIESYRATLVATATTTQLWASTAQVQDWTGTPTITDFPDAPRAGVWRVVYPNVGTIFTDNANLDVQGGTYTVEAGDKVYIEALTISTFKVFIEKQTGAPILIPDASTTVKGIVELSTGAEFLTGTSTTLVPPVQVIRNNTTGFSAVNTTTGGTTIAFTSIIPTWANEVTVHFQGFSTNGTDTWILQVGVGGVYVTAGYESFGTNFSGGAVAGAASTNGMAVINAVAAANSYGGHMTFKRTAETNVWTAVGGVGCGTAANGGSGWGSIDAGGALDSVRWTTGAGANTVDVNGGLSVSWRA